MKKRQKPKRVYAITCSDSDCTYGCYGVYSDRLEAVAKAAELVYACAKENKVEVRDYDDPDVKLGRVRVTEMLGDLMPLSIPLRYEKLPDGSKLCSEFVTVSVVETDYYERITRESTAEVP